MNSCEVCNILPDIKPEFTLIDGTFWSANLRDTDQTLLGTSFITAKRHVPELDYLTPEEDDEFILIRNALLGAIRRSFNPVTFNVSCLKNDAFKANPDNTTPDSSHVHWHIKPRYTSSPISLNQEVFSDPEPGRYLEISQYERHTPTTDTAIKIAHIIKSNFGI